MKNALFAALALFLAACGGTSSGGTTQALGPDTTGTVTVWHYSNANDVKAVQDYSALFTKKYPKVTVNLQYVEFSETPKRAIAAAAAKNGPDVFIYGGNEVNAMYKAGTFRSIDDRWSSFADKGQFPDGVITKFNNHVYGVKGYVNLTGLWYNKNIPQPTLTVWPAPQQQFTFSQIVLYVQRYVQDVGTLTQTLEVPQRWFLAVLTRLAKELMLMIPEVAKGMSDLDKQTLLQEDKDRWAEGWASESDASPTMLRPNIRAYTR